MGAFGSIPQELEEIKLFFCLLCRVGFFLDHFDHATNPAAFLKTLPDIAEAPTVEMSLEQDLLQ